MTDIVQLNLDEYTNINIFNIEKIILQLDYLFKFKNEFLKSKNKQKFINEFFSNYPEELNLKSNYYDAIDLEDYNFRKLVNLDLSKAPRLNEYVKKKKEKLALLLNTSLKIINESPSIKLDPYMMKHYLEMFL